MGSEEKQTSDYRSSFEHGEQFTPEHNALIQMTWDKFKTFEWKDGDVTVVSVPRSGIHITWLITRMLVQGNTNPILDPMKESRVWLPSFKDTQTGTRVLTSHFHPHDVKESVLKDGNRKFIYVSRNCKDVSVLQFRFFKKFKVFSEKELARIWREYLPTFYNNVPEDPASVNSTSYASCWWVFHVRAWEDYAEKTPDAAILFLYVEDILRKPEGSIRQIAEFLSVPLPGELLQGILAAVSIGNLKSAPLSEELSELWEQGTNNPFPANGAVADWKNWYTVAQNELADGLLAKQMIGSKINPTPE